MQGIRNHSVRQFLAGSASRLAAVVAVLLSAAICLGYVELPEMQVVRANGTVKTYRHVKITALRPGAMVEFTHDAGAGRLPLANLPESIRAWLAGPDAPLPPPPAEEAEPEVKTYWLDLTTGRYFTARIPFFSSERLMKIEISDNRIVYLEGGPLHRSGSSIIDTRTGMVIAHLPIGSASQSVSARHDFVNRPAAAESSFDESRRGRTVTARGGGFSLGVPQGWQNAEIQGGLRLSHPHDQLWMIVYPSPSPLASEAAVAAILERLLTHYGIIPERWSKTGTLATMGGLAVHARQGWRSYGDNYADIHCFAIPGLANGLLAVGYADWDSNVEKELIPQIFDSIVRSLAVPRTAGEMEPPPTLPPPDQRPGKTLPHISSPNPSGIAGLDVAAMLSVVERQHLTGLRQPVDVDAYKPPSTFDLLWPGISIAIIFLVMLVTCPKLLFILLQMIGGVLYMCIIYTWAKHFRDEQKTALWPLLLFAAVLLGGSPSARADDGRRARQEAFYSLYDLPSDWKAMTADDEQTFWRLARHDGKNYEMRFDTQIMKSSQVVAFTQQIVAGLEQNPYVVSCRRSTYGRWDLWERVYEIEMIDQDWRRWKEWVGWNTWRGDGKGIVVIVHMVADGRWDLPYFLPAFNFERLWLLGTPTRAQELATALNVLPAEGLDHLALQEYLPWGKGPGQGLRWLLVVGIRNVLYVVFFVATIGMLVCFSSISINLLSFQLGWVQILLGAFPVLFGISVWLQPIVLAPKGENIFWHACLVGTDGHVVTSRNDLAIFSDDRRKQKKYLNNEALRMQRQYPEIEVAYRLLKPVPSQSFAYAEPVFLLGPSYRQIDMPTSDNDDFMSFYSDKDTLSYSAKRLARPVGDRLYFE